MPKGRPAPSLFLRASSGQCAPTWNMGHGHMGLIDKLRAWRGNMEARLVVLADGRNALLAEGLDKAAGYGARVFSPPVAGVQSAAAMALLMPPVSPKAGAKKGKALPSLSMKPTRSSGGQPPQ